MYKYPQHIRLHIIRQEKEGEQKYQCDSEARNRINAQLPLLPKKESDHPFRGLLASQLHCKKCYYKV